MLLMCLQVVNKRSLYLRISMQQQNVTKTMRMKSDHAATIICSRTGLVLKS